MSRFKVQEHTITTSYIREYPRATASGQDEDLKLAVKQYTPVDTQDPKPGDVTIVGGHANGFPKVCYIRLFCPKKGILTSRRNFTSLYGTNFIRDSRRKALKSVASGSQT
jgi:hypothetical protein